jgi:hypothetical protein
VGRHASGIASAHLGIAEGELVAAPKSRLLSTQQQVTVSSPLAVQPLEHAVKPRVLATAILLDFGYDFVACRPTGTCTWGGV